MKKLSIGLISLFIVIAVIITVIINTSDPIPNKVKAENSKTQCIITKGGMFFCEGNKGYLEAINNN
ncbi:hypothetical protein [Virgibacillus sp. SK37]|uniref:hypothetical protein n=1 Tax=Virgibacillus sp. SK37 TaxID=403957 RepID=UPI0004D0F564|nr:hypothetical protein [Virgibacillus sp. SK37]AIF45396.1 hypothetical protein X953_09950 [Virgibacillus sp. SK37]